MNESFNQATQPSQESSERKLSPAQKQSIDFLEGGTEILGTLTFREATDPYFLQTIGEMRLASEVCLYETPDGLARMSTGSIDELGNHGISDNIAHVQMERGRIDIHSHPCDRNTDERFQLAPSSNDMHVYQDRFKHTNSPSLIINGHGAVIIGINPIDSNTEVEEYGGKIKTIARLKIEWFEDFNDRILRGEPGDFNDKRKILYSLAVAIGFIIKEISWDAQDDDSLEICFDPEKATEFWEAKNADQEKTKLNPQEKRDEIWNIFERHQLEWKRLQKAWLEQ